MSLTAKPESVQPSESHEPTFSTKDHPKAAANWMLAQARKGYLPAPRAESSVSALNSVLKLDLEPGELTVEGLMANLNTILDVRWRNSRKDANARTIDTYRGKILWLLEEYKYRCDNPAGYNAVERFKKYNDNAQKKSTGAKKEERPAPLTLKDMVEKAKDSLLAPEATCPKESKESKGATYTIPLGAKQASIELPQDTMLDLPTATSLCSGVFGHLSFSLADLEKLIGRLASQAHDFDFTRSVTHQLFSREGV